MSTTGPAAALALVRQRTFGPYFVGNALSASGTWFQNLAASLLVYRLTHAAWLLAHQLHQPIAAGRLIDETPRESAWTALDGLSFMADA